MPQGLALRACCWFLGALAVAAGVTGPSYAAGARPLFQLPFPCGQQWTASTYGGHKPNTNSIDLMKAGGGSAGQPIVASYAGTVSFSGWDDGGGWMVEVNHGNGWRTSYLHMIERPAVATGAGVARGQQIGRVGSTGDSGTPHLHYQQMQDGVTVRAEFDGRPVTTAVGAPQTLTSNNCQSGGGHTVVAWADANVRSCPGTGCSISSRVHAGNSYPATCWITGERVTAEGVTNDKWVRLPLAAGGTGYVSGIYLRGDATGGVTTAC
ncbi:peptidoglycan DD-metalloendopeptidase family protein [Streptomyces erythrochromogenes]|uniref:peptidoglycan DD-metalloendopeptidase family protein n=1 Tax=Streptomyces erythrochromogenes TaxID=285574 RepID=UPI003866AF93|nr:M23 family metallopeptidase [Streptomyces erythrochromogenes]